MDYIKNFKQIKISKANSLFFLAYALLILYRVLKSSTIGINDKGITYLVVIGLLVITIFNMRIRVKTFFSIGLICPVALFCIWRTWDPILPIIALLIISCRSVDFKQIVRVSYALVFPVVIFVVMLSQIGVIEDVVSYRSFGAVACHGMGFNHSSALPTYFCFLFLENNYLKKDKTRIYKLIFWMIVGYAIYSVCAERLRFYLLGIACIMSLLESLYNRNSLKKVFKYISSIIYPVSCAATLLLGYFYNPQNNVLKSLNILLSNRLYYEHYTFENFGISLFGRQIEMGLDALTINGNSEYFYLDSGYVYVFAIYGLLIGGLIIMTYMWGCIKSFECKNYALYMWFLCIAVDTLVGNQLLSVWINPLILFPFCKAGCEYTQSNSLSGKSVM